MAYFVQRATKHALRTRTDKYAQQLHIIVERYEHSDKKVGIRKTKQAQRQRNGALRKNTCDLVEEREREWRMTEKGQHICHNSIQLLKCFHWTFQKQLCKKFG